MDFSGKLWTLIIVLVILGSMASFFISVGNKADGCATDTVARISYGGWFWKTWRVELTNDHPVSDGSGGMIYQYYGVENNTILIDQLQQYQNSGQRVKICYKSNLFVPLWQYADAEVIYSVQIV